MKELVTLIKELEQYKISNVNLIALVSDSSSEVMFYCDYDGNRVQSNSLVEGYGLDSNIIDVFYDKVTIIIRNSNQFDVNKTNIVKISNNQTQFEYDEKACRTYRIIKEWTKTAL
ncbi:MAG: hypothetical protein MR304_02870 [Eubacterium sp.]|nr:hypothetical protein [Eubacterium sp.]